MNEWRLIATQANKHFILITLNKLCLAKVEFQQLKNISNDNNNDNIDKQPNVWLNFCVVT